MPATDRNRPMRLRTPLGADALLVTQLSGVEALGQLFEYDLTLVSERADLNPDEILAQSITVEIALPEDRTRFVNGYVTEFSQVGYGERYHEYRATIRPWLWFLTRMADCRVFQDQSIPEIFESVIRRHGFTDYELRLKDAGAYDKWEYCVQYRETDFNFLSRLLEQEGLYYFFEHQDGMHRLVLVDDSSGHRTEDGYAQVPYYPPTANDAQRERDHLREWSISRTLTSGAYATTDYDEDDPRRSLKVRTLDKRSKTRGDYEVFDYPLEFQSGSSTELDRIAKTRLAELQVPHAVARGSGDAGGLLTGRKFQLEKYPRDALNIEYLITSSQLSVTSDSLQSSGGGAATELSVALQAIDATVEFRPARVTPKPIVQGAQTAVVVGKAGEEIWTDWLGRVMVQFHWDRHGRKDETSSCWVRVAQVWAGEQWGAMHIPRIGQEVIVSFLEGDPDQPIITGRVYNGTHKPPYDLPANQTQSGIKSRSSKGGTAENFNEIRFEDKKGEEELYFHAEKDLTTEVENDQAIEVGHDESVEIKNDRKATVGNNETVKIGKDQATEIGSNETRKVGKDRKTDIGQNESTAVGKDRQRTVGQNESIKVGKRFILEVGDEITIRTGSSQLVMKKDGTILLKGVKITIDAAQSLTEKAGQKIDIKAMQINGQGTKVQLQGTMLDLKASAIATLKGSLTKIG
jgi:type VI secretion system secreted protein VgrG